MDIVRAQAEVVVLIQRKQVALVQVLVRQLHHLDVLTVFVQLVRQLVDQQVVLHHMLQIQIIQMVMYLANALMERSIITIAV